MAEDNELKLVMSLNTAEFMAAVRDAVSAALIEVMAALNDYTTIDDGTASTDSRQ